MNLAAWFRRKFLCHQWLPDRCVCSRCGITMEEAMVDERRKLYASMTPGARRAMDILRESRDAAIAREADALWSLRTLWNAVR